MAQYTLSTRVKKPLPLSLLGILVDPIDSGEVVVTHTSSWALHVPVQRRTIFRCADTIIKPYRRVRIERRRISVLTTLRRRRASIRSANGRGEQARQTEP